MKTGGTRNFLKMAGAILMLVAVFASSCNKYADDFKAINTKLDALATQVAGVTTLSTDMTTLKGKVDGLVTSVGTLGTTAGALTDSLRAVSKNVSAIQATLKAVADSGKATVAIVRGLKTSLFNLSEKVRIDNDTIMARLSRLVTSNNAQKEALGDLKSSNDSILKHVAALQIALSGKSTDEEITALTIRGLQLMLLDQQHSLDLLLANSNMYNGDVTITTLPEMRFFAKKMTQMGIINGNLIINTTLLAEHLDSVNIIVQKIGAVIGSSGTERNSVTVTSTSTTTLLDLSRLVSVAGNYTVTGVDIDDSNLSYVGGNFLVNYDGPYLYPNLTSVGYAVGLTTPGSLTLTRIATSTSKVGTTSINLPVVDVKGSVFDGTNAASVLVYPEATSIILSGGVTSLTAAVATQITLGADDYASGLIISAPTAAAVVDLSAATAGTGAISVTTGNGGTVKFTKLLSTAGGVTVNTGTSGTVDFSVLATAVGGVTLTGPAVIRFPLLVSGLLTSNATDVTLDKHEWAAPAVLANVVTLTLGNINNPVSLDAYNTTLVTATVSGKAHETWAATVGAGAVVTTASAKLTTLTLGGNLASANLVGLTKLVSLTTLVGSQINTFKVDGASLLTAMTLGHTFYQPTNTGFGGPGSDLIITNNPLLTTLKSSGDFPREITITGNATLASVDLLSYQTKLLDATGAVTTITINTNALVGDYTNAIAITATTPYHETVIKSADLFKLKDFIAKYPASGNPDLIMAINIDKVTLGGVAGNATLAARMVSDATGAAPAGGHTMVPGGAPFDFGAPATGITTQDEFTLVVE